MTLTPVFFWKSVAARGLFARPHGIGQIDKAAEEDALSMHANAGAPSLIVGVPVDAAMTASIVNAALDISRIEGVVGLSEVGDAVVVPHAVDVIDPSRWPSSVNDCPRDAMRLVRATEDGPVLVPAWISGSERLLAGASAVPLREALRIMAAVFGASLPEQLSGIRIVAEKLANEAWRVLVMCWFWQVNTSFPKLSRSLTAIKQRGAAL